MKTEEQIKSVVKAYEDKRKEYERQMNMAETFIQANVIMENTEGYLLCVKQYYENQNKIEQMQKCITLLKWLLDIKE